ncbi:FG-GAP-like repeat-containing protein, partial [Zooshikella ganghwensis]|uniref:FG-GAP-like repeat-containing protein n=1 Tax=Zooshikella ganghwensis TaxID=202772 RepID=UPI0004893F10
MNRLHITLACLTLSIFQVFIPSFAVADPPNEVGTVAGAFSVGTDGAANYRIPLQLPLGVNGLKPDLALEYDSQKKGGLVGTGWRLTGFPAIARCPTTLEQDGFIDGVDFDNNDKFCLNGQRLVAINGDYGKNGTEYRTEHDSYKKIISYGAVGSAPAYFKVWYKNGEMAEFGHTDDAQVEAQGKSDIVHWAINKIEDRFGNTINFQYAENNDIGEHYPTSVSYANVIVNFIYTDNNYTTTRFLQGSRFTRTRHLTKIEMTAANKKQFYTLRYSRSTNDRRHWMKGIRFCHSEQTCLPETTFAWDHAETTVSNYKNVPLETPGIENDQSAYSWLVGDVNGDGKADLIAQRLTASGNVVNVRMADNSGLTRPHLWYQDSQNWANHHRLAQDMNGDGLTDLVSYQLSSSGNFVYVQLSTGNGFAAPKKWTHITTNWDGYKALLADVNGDGRSDIVYYALTSGLMDIEVQLSEGDHFAPAQKWVVNTQNWNEHQLFAADVNGDGLQDLVVSYIGKAGNQLYVIKSDNPTKVVEHWQQSTEGWNESTHHIADMNGDGNDDVVSSYLGRSGNLVYVSLSTGTGFLPMQKWFDLRNDWTDHTRRIADLNGDGRQDLVADYFGDNGHHTYIQLSQGDGLRELTKWNTLYTNWQQWFRLLGDLNGDGQVDLAAGRLSSQGHFTHYQYVTGSVARQITQITDGLGHTTQINYTPLTHNTTFTKSTGSQYPVKDVQPAVYVVSEVKQANGIGGELTTQYHYKGLKRHLRGLGALGFAEITSTQVETGIKTTDQYLQDVANRKIGLLSRSQTWSATGVLLKDTQQTWQVNTLDDGDIKRFQTYLVSRETQQKSLQDEWLSTLTETFSYDDWGNTTEAKQVIKDALGQQTSTTTNTYQNDESNWLIGLATQTQATNVSVSGDSQTRTTQFSYDATTGALTQRIQEPGQGDYVLTTDFKYDRFGNLIEEQTQGAKVAVRKQTYTYDAQGRFLTSTTNALGHKAQQTSDAFWGVPLTTTDANGLVTQYGYDAFGRLTSQTAPDNTQTTLTRGWCNAETECPAGAVYWVKTQA